MQTGLKSEFFAWEQVRVASPSAQIAQVAACSLLRQWVGTYRTLMFVFNVALQPIGFYETAPYGEGSGYARSTWPKSSSNRPSGISPSVTLLWSEGPLSTVYWLSRSVPELIMQVIHCTVRRMGGVCNTTPDTPLAGIRPTTYDYESIANGRPGVNPRGLPASVVPNLWINLDLWSNHSQNWLLFYALTCKANPEGITRVGRRLWPAGPPCVLLST